MAAEESFSIPSSRAFLLLITGNQGDEFDLQCLKRWIEIIRCIRRFIKKLRTNQKKDLQVFLSVVLDPSVIDLLEKVEDENELCGIVAYKENHWLEKEDVDLFLDSLASDLDKVSEVFHQVSGDFDSINHADKVARKIHILIDNLPKSEGSVVFETFWILQTDTLTLSSCIPIYGALKRLQEWNNSKITILHHCSLPPKTEFLKYWSNTLSLSCVSVNEEEMELVRSNSLWHGKILIHNNQDQLESTVLPGFILTQAPSNDVLNFNSAKLINHRVLEEFFGNTDLHILDVISRETVPLHRIYPFHLKLSLPNYPIRSSKRFMDRFLLQDISKDVAMLACFRRTLVQGPRDYAAWTKHVCSNQNNDTPDCTQQKLSANLPLFLICHDDGEGCNVYPLRSYSHAETKIDAELAMIGATHSLSGSSSVDDIVAMLPVLPSETFLQRQTDLVLAQLKALENFTDKTFIYQDIITELYNVISKSRNDHKDDPLWFQTTTHPESLNHGQSEVELDPKLWPERIYLQNLESNTSKEKVVSTTATLGGLPVPVARKPAAPALDAKDILKYFCNDAFSHTGKPDTTKARKTSKLAKALNSSFDDVQHAKYPSALHHKFHGIEYCLDSQDALKKDRQTSTLQACYISSETSSTCLPSKAVPSPNPDIARVSRDKHRACNKKGESAQKFASKQKDVKSNKHEIGEKRTVITNEGEVNKKKRKRKRNCPESHDSSTEESSGKESTQETRSQRHMRRLQLVVDHTLKSQGIIKDHPCYENCSQRLLLLCKSFLKDLKTSEGLNDEMKRLAKSNVKQVVKFELRRQKDKTIESN